MEPMELLHASLELWQIYGCVKDSSICPMGKEGMDSLLIQVPCWLQRCEILGRSIPCWPGNGDGLLGLMLLSMVPGTSNRLVSHGCWMPGRNCFCLAIPYVGVWCGGQGVGLIVET